LLYRADGANLPSDEQIIKAEKPTENKDYQPDDQGGGFVVSAPADAAGDYLLYEFVGFVLHKRNSTI
jgi:hypothetical protein